MFGGEVFGPDFEESYVYFGAAIAVTSNGKQVVASAPGTEKDGAFNAGALHILQESTTDTNSTWTRAHSLDGPGSSEFHISSVAMTLDGRTIAAGYPYYEGGLVQIFDESQDWQQGHILKPENSSALDETWFGFATSFSQDGDFLAVGAPLDEMSGSVRVFARQADRSWEQVGGVIRAEGFGELFGWSLSLVHAETTRVAVGAPANDTYAGLLRVYELVETGWEQVGQTLAGSRTLNRFGEACDLTSDGKLLVVGVRGSPFEAGEVKLFREVNGDWVADDQIIAGSEPGDGFGSAVSFTPNGDYLAIGSPGSNVFGEASGYIQVWAFDGTVWVQEGSRIGGTVHSEYGSSLAISEDGTRVVGGAPQAEYDGSITAAGHFKVYDRDETV